jgi:hypothetical protein
MATKALAISLHAGQLVVESLPASGALARAVARLPGAVATIPLLADGGDRESGEEFISHPDYAGEPMGGLWVSPKAIRPRSSIGETYA